MHIFVGSMQPQEQRNQNPDLLQSVWPDDRIKSGSIFSTLAQKAAK